MSDLRTLLGDRYAPALQAAVLADNPEAITSAQAVGGKLGQLMYLAAVDRLARVLAAVLPDLLAAAWDQGYAMSELGWKHVYDGHPCPPGEMCPECAQPNPYRQGAPHA